MRSQHAIMDDCVAFLCTCPFIALFIILWFAVHQDQSHYVLEENIMERQQLIAQKFQ
jgi:hypothetical protein